MRLLVWGGRSKARIILRMIEQIYGDKFIVTGIFDQTITELPFQAETKLYSTNSDLNKLISGSTHYIVCIGGEKGYARYMISKKLEERGLRPVNVVSEHSLLDDLNYVGVGIQVMPGAIIHKFTNVGDYCIFNTNSTVDHECNIGHGVHVMGSASIAGRVNIGDFSIIGTNATVLPRITIGKNVYVGAGAVVIEDIEDGLVVAGVPSRRLRKFEPICDLSAFD
jgi:sugar O-acyltransferase (sialic acid O-acetyltransferase NeuD family)